MRTRLFVAFLLVSTVGVLGVAVDPVSGSAQEAEQRIETDHFVITYEEGMEADAQQVASVADDYYRVLFQRFGQNPQAGRLRVALTSRSTLPCETEGVAGCYNGLEGTIYISDGDPELFYHELVHRYQDIAGVGTAGQQPLELGIEGTAEYLSAPSTELAQRADFAFDADRYFTVRDADGDEYAQLALFSEFLLHEYGREAFDVLYEQPWYFPAGGSVTEELEAITGTAFSTVRERFLDQRGQQRQRLSEGGSALPGFSYRPFVVSAGTEVTFDARTPGVIEQLGRSWYPDRPSAYEWDFDGDGAIDATGPVVSRTFEEPANATVTLFVTVDGQRRKASQDILSRVAPDGSGPTLAVADVTRGAGLTYPADRNADYRGVAGAQATLNVSLVNRGLARTETVTLSLANRTVAEQTVELARDSTAELTLAHTIPGDLSGAYEYEITVDGRTSERTVYVRQPALSLDWESIAVPEGNSALLLAGKVRPGERVRLTVDPTATEFESQVTERVAFSVGDRTIGEREVTFGPGTETVTVEFDAPSTPGTYQLSGRAVDAASPVQGFSRRLTVVEDVALAQAQNAAGECSLSVTEIEFSGIYTGDTGQYVDPPEVSAINPGDEVTYTIHAVRNDECEGLPELPVTVGDEQQTVLEEAIGTRQYTFRVTQTFGSAGTYELQTGGTVLTEINVTAASADSDETSDQTDSTDEKRETGAADGTDSTEDQTGEQDGESQSTEDTTERGPEPPRENESEPSSDGAGPGFGIGAALAGTGGYLLRRRNRG